jgi:predicted negative regulator of RcsB-dependent stress response
MKRYIYIFSLSLLAIAWRNSNAADQPPIGPQFADYLFHQADYYNAITEYQRFLFFNPNSPFNDAVYYRLAAAAAQCGQWEKAIDQLDDLGRQSIDSALSAKVALTVSSLYMQRGYFSLARYHLPEKVKNNDYVNFYSGWSYLLEANWDSARIAFAGVPEKTDDPSSLGVMARKITADLDNFNRHNYKSPVLAWGLSFVLPGSGQMYAGRYWEGVGLLAINTVFAWWTINAVRHKDYRAAGLVYLVGWSRFHWGAQANAYQRAKEYNTAIDTQRIRYLKAKHLFSKYVQ